MEDLKKLQDNAEQREAKRMGWAIIAFGLMCLLLVILIKPYIKPMVTKQDAKMNVETPIKSP